TNAGRGASANGGRCSRKARASVPLRTVATAKSGGEEASTREATRRKPSSSSTTSTGTACEGCTTIGLGPPSSDTPGVANQFFSEVQAAPSRYLLRSTTVPDYIDGAGTSRVYRPQRRIATYLVCPCLGAEGGCRDPRGRPASHRGR